MKFSNPAANCPYLVGDLYHTTRAGNPADTWPGTTWRQITDCFIRAADASHPAGSTGGSWTHTQTEEELAPHAHQIPYNAGYTAGPDWVGANGTSENQVQNTAIAGEGKPMDITNKFYSAYIWQRTA